MIKNESENNNPQFLSVEDRQNNYVNYNGAVCRIMTDVIPTQRKEDKEFVISLPLSYSIEFKKEIVFLENEKDSEIEAAKIYLNKSGTTVFTKIIPIGHLEESKGRLFEDIREYLIDKEPLRTIEWMKTQIDPCYENQQPAWIRDKPIRNYQFMVNDKEYLLSLSDEGNMQRFKEEIGNDIIFDEIETKPNEIKYIPYSWHYNHYERGETDFTNATRKIMNSIGTHELPIVESRRNAEESKGEKDCDKRYLNLLNDLLLKTQSHAVRSRNLTNQNHLKEMVSSSSSHVKLSMMTNYNLISCENGVFDTSTGEFTPIYNCDKFKSEYPTVHIPRRYIPGVDGRPSKFIQHLYTIFEDNTTPGLTQDERIKNAADMAKYFMSLLGYMMIAGNPEQKFVFLYGDGLNGKSATMDILEGVLGNEYAKAPIKEIFAGADDKKPSLAKGISRRLLVFSEASTDNIKGCKTISSSEVKRISGETKINDYRRMYVEGTDTKINCLPVGVTNDRPKFDNELNYSLRRRLILIYFPHKFTESETNKNIVQEIVNSEADQIFSYILEYTHNYLKNGLPELPEICLAAGKEFLAGEPYSSFVLSEFEKTTGTSDKDKLSLSAISKQYINWCHTNGHSVDTMKVSIGYDKYGGEINDIDLKKAEKTKLKNAFSVYGYEACKVHGSDYFRCKCKSVNY